MLDNISLYWHTASATSSARIYWEDSFARPSKARVGGADASCDDRGRETCILD